MNLRDFKKDVEYFVGEFVDDCSLFIALNPHKDQDKVADVISEAVDLYNDLKDKAMRKLNLSRERLGSQDFVKRCTRKRMLFMRNLAQ